MLPLWPLLAGQGCLPLDHYFPAYKGGPLVRCCQLQLASRLQPHRPDWMVSCLWTPFVWFLETTKYRTALEATCPSCRPTCFWGRPEFACWLLQLVHWTVGGKLPNMQTWCRTGPGMPWKDHCQIALCCSLKIDGYRDCTWLHLSLTCDAHLYW